MWDERASLLTLDYPPGRANLASVQNFQLLPFSNEAIAPDVTDDAAASGGGALSAAAEAYDDAAFTATLVHGLMHETDARHGA